MSELPEQEEIPPEKMSNIDLTQEIALRERQDNNYALIFTGLVLLNLPSLTCLISAAISVVNGPNLYNTPTLIFDCLAYGYLIGMTHNTHVAENRNQDRLNLLGRETVFRNGLKMTKVLGFGKF